MAVLALAPAASAARQGPAVHVGAAASGRDGIRLAVRPTSGALPLAVTFTLAAPRAVSWRIAFGDGGSAGAKGQPPATITHVYRVRGSFVARLSTTYASVTTVTKLPTVQTPTTPVPAVAVSPRSLPLVTVSLLPGVRANPRAVAFALATIDPARITSWRVVFGDGTSTAGRGAPRSSVKHTYAHAGTFKAYVVFEETRADSFQRYIVPGKGLTVEVP